MMNKREFRAAKGFFGKAKALTPTIPWIADEIKQTEKYSRERRGKKLKIEI
jgi:hypothetical protein